MVHSVLADELKPPKVGAVLRRLREEQELRARIVERRGSGACASEGEAADERSSDASRSR